ncbi:hypothetical protein V2J09_010567 [Rumex salicifolius]
MITFMDPKEKIKEGDNYLDSQLWHACAGGMVQMPPVNTKVFYFVQGHAEHSSGNIDFRNFPRLPPYILCRVEAIKYLADRDTDEVFAKIRLMPVTSNEIDFIDEDGGVNGPDAQDSKPASFAKTLTQSDANNGGGFSVPRYCAETIFPRLDYSADPPVQNIIAKDVHGEAWKFRHIYRGTPRRHLLTTGWSTFVNAKKLVAGDSIVFLRADNGDLCVGIRRAKRGIGGGHESSSGWNPAASVMPYSGFSAFLSENNSRMSRNGNGTGLNPNGGNTLTKGKVKAESVIEVASFAANGQPFEVVYYPRAGTPEFVVKAGNVKAALQIRWCGGMRFKMPFETEDSSRISWFMGTISSVQVADPMRWPDSPWRLLQVTWDEPDLLQNVKRVSPWLVELVSNMPTIHLSPFSPPRKKFRFPQHPDFPIDTQLPLSTVQGNFLGPSNNNNPYGCLPETSPAGMQGARHAQFGLSLPDFHLSKLQPGLFPPGFPAFDLNNNTTLSSRPSVSSTIPDPNSSENVSCFLTMGSSSQTPKKPSDSNTRQFILFGKQIQTEQQSNAFPSNKEPSSSNDPELDTGHCKVFMDSDDVGRTLDLSLLNSYEELCLKLTNMFEIEGSELLSRVTYSDSTGSAKSIRDEPFSDFARKARRLTIMGDSGSDS